MSSLAAHLLVAVPQLPDSNFNRAVVLVITHDEQGAFGVILNRSSHVRLRDIWSEISKVVCGSEEYIRIGGPVEGPLLAIHTVKEFAEQCVLPGVYISKDRQHLDELVDEQHAPVRFFSGYSGWGPDQLEQEMEAGGWLTMAASPESIFGNNEDLWKDVAEEIGREVLLTDFKVKQTPPDPSLN